MSLVLSGSSGLTFPDNSTQAVGFYGFKNRIINGAMVIDQRNAGTSVNPASGSTVYTLDRWAVFLSQTSKLTIQRSSTAPTGFNNSLLVTSSSAYSVGASEAFQVFQNIEGFNVADFGWGAAGAATVTFSFWVRSSLTGTFGGSLCNSGQTRLYPFSYTINTANTWEQKTITIAGDTTGTWLKDNSTGIGVILNMGNGTNFQGTTGAWTASTIYGPSGGVNVVGTSGATFYITGVQLEKGSTATSFDYRPYGTELMLCQRYYYVINNGGSGNQYSNFANAVAYSAGASSFRFQVTLPVLMRSVPSFLQKGNLELLGVVSGGVSGLSITDGGGNPVFGLNMTSPSAGAAGQASIVRAGNDTTAALTFSAEL
jgi:hypothetical protein